MTNSIDVSIVLPILNEEKNLEELQSKLTEALVKLGREYEIVAIDDGSTDDTFEVLN